MPCRGEATITTRQTERENFLTVNQTKHRQEDSGACGLRCGAGARWRWRWCRSAGAFNLSCEYRESKRQTKDRHSADLA